MTLKAEVHGIQPNDFPSWQDFAQHVSPDPFDDYGWFTVDIGSRGGAGADMWQVVIATPAAIGRIKARSKSKADFKDQRGKFKGLIVEKFDAQAVEKAIQDYVTELTATSWDTISNHLKAAMYWEYEGMGGPSRPTRNKRLVTVSKFLSKYLRHEPEALGVSLEPGGWVGVEDLLAGAAKIGFTITRDELAQVIAESDKQRFALDEAAAKIRANQGHSTEVDLQLKEVDPPEQLFHGTVQKFLDSILAEGLKKMDRHDVHLSTDVQTATKVGERRGKPVILVIDSAGMAADGFKFRLSANGVWLTDHVPPQYIRLA